MSYPMRKLAVVAAIVLPAFAFATSTGNAANRSIRARTTWDSVYTAEQAGRGESTYARNCARCHRAELGGADESPALTGGAFMGAWNGVTLHELHDRIRTTMPTDTPGTYSRQDVSDVMAYMLKYNRFPAGKAELPTGDEELKAITFVSTRP
jgi:mono/diheme cytochrome c family protein